MREIVESVKRVTDIMGEITAASEEQTSGIEQINQAITQMDATTQQNASLVEEAAAASQALQDQASNLAQVVSVFKLDGMQKAVAVAPVTPQRDYSSAKPAVMPLVKKAPPQAGLGAPRPRRVTAAQPAAQPTAEDGWEEF
jgi:uncharacterized phage infection (PIP) family protein YhgE